MKKIALALSSLSLLALVACGDGTATACEEYVTSYNELECTGSDLSDDYCESESDSTCSRAEYWTCLSEGTKCDGDVPDIDTADCNAACN